MPSDGEVGQSDRGTKQYAEMTVAMDRRRQRSKDPLVALFYQLSKAKNDDKLDAVVLADGCGLVVAGAGAWAVCEELAAYAPLLAAAQAKTSARGPAAAGPQSESRVEELRPEVDIREVHVDGQKVLLCARTGRRASTPGRTANLDRAAQGVVRILTTADAA